MKSSEKLIPIFKWESSESFLNIEQPRFLGTRQKHLLLWDPKILLAIYICMYYSTVYTPHQTSKILIKKYGSSEHALYFCLNTLLSNISNSILWLFGQRFFPKLLRRKFLRYKPEKLFFTLFLQLIHELK
jgi:hypothetical protein